jgi:FMN-dependent NADH-azoreductase
MQSYDFVSLYLKTILGFMVMTDVEVVRVEGTAMNTGKAKAPDDALDLVTVWMLVANFGLARKSQ